MDRAAYENFSDYFRSDGQMTLQPYRTGCRELAVSDIFPSGFAARPSHSAVFVFTFLAAPNRNARFSTGGLGFAATSGVDNGAGYFVLEPKLHRKRNDDNNNNDCGDGDNGGMVRARNEKRL